MKHKKKKRKELVRGGVIPSGALEPPMPESGNGLGGPAFHQQDVTVPHGVEDEGPEVPWFRIGPLMGTIVLLAVGWICFVAWMIKWVDLNHPEWWKP